MEKRGQLTIFIIIGIVIVAAAVIIYLLFPGIIIRFGLEEQTPSGYMQSCMQERLEEVVEQVSLRGGSMEPVLGYWYQDSYVEFLCYQEEYYIPCVVQQPMLKLHVEEEIAKAIEEEANACLDDMESYYKGAGYDVSLEDGFFYVLVIPGKIDVLFDTQLVLERGERNVYDSFSISLNNNLYELVMTAFSIVQWETRFGDSETTYYMNSYPDLKVEKTLDSDGNKVYTLTHRESGDKFRFASRSVVWPPGYGTSKMAY